MNKQIYKYIKDGESSATDPTLICGFNEDKRNKQTLG
jgi:hypothetical protein